MRFHRIRKALPFLLFPFFTFPQIGCSLLVGNIKPVEEKADDYGVMDLSKSSPNWIRLTPEEAGAESTLLKGDSPPEISDVAYQAKKTASIISLNSVCRAASEPLTDLKAMTQVLFLGMTDLEVQSQKPLQIQGRPALESTVRGKLNGEDMILRTVVFRHNRCVYDLVYMARPTHFPQNEQDFAHFIASLRLK
jgi:hypothetical protein